ncbi:nucleoside-diphosphate kinase [Azotosporobacter soli]|uniref:nucleoside-diphosphate kinase n=1 Tax=Azotosporobacter soli TaxID=3055040 RepID=UPI0031FF40A4
MEQTLVLLKPDAIERGLCGQLIGRIERKGFRIVALKMMLLPHEVALKHYSEHREKDFFTELVAFITSGPLAALVVEGDNVVQLMRSIMGATDPAKAAPGTIRSDYATSVRYNVIHGSDSLDSAKREIALFFKPEEICH